MTLVPTRHLYPATFFDSSQSSKLRFFRYGSSITFNKYTFYVTVQNQQQSQKRYQSTARITHRRADKNLSTGNWIDKWNETHHSDQTKQPSPVVDYESGESNDERNGDSVCSTMERIVERLKILGYGERESKVAKIERLIKEESLEDNLYVEEGVFPNSNHGFPKEPPLGDGSFFSGGREVRRRGRSSLMEPTLSESEFGLLTFQKKNNARIGASRVIRIGGDRVTQELVNKIHEKWKTSEIVRLKIEGPLAENMKRMHELLEQKTGGLVVWRSSTNISLYRGVSYEVPLLHLNKIIFSKGDISSTKTVSIKPIRQIAEFSTALERLEPTSEENEDTKKPPEMHHEAEVEQILNSLGPRYEDWPGPDPLPVDADLLPGIVHNFQPPFRILPYGVKRFLGQKEATSLRRLAKVLPPHFAIGRSRKFQGLAVAVIKLWEKSLIAKIAFKRGVQLNTSEKMAEEVKSLTGGMLLYQNKEFMIIYRGKDFLSAPVVEALMEWERLSKPMLDEEEQARLRASARITPRTKLPEQSSTAGTLGETLDADAKWGMKLDESHEKKVMRQVGIMKRAESIRKLEHNLALTEQKLMKAERALGKVELYLQPSNKQAEPENITDEDRYMFRKLGLRMKAFLLLGRRGVFDGTVENMHLHWKYRELVKVKVNAKTFKPVKRVALELEAESRGILVSVDKISKKKFAIIVFRGRDYKPPSMLRPKNLLSKRKALARSIAIQRQQDLLKHSSAVKRKVNRLRSELKKMNSCYDDRKFGLESEPEIRGLQSGKSSLVSDGESGGDHRWKRFRFRFDELT